MPDPYPALAINGPPLTSDGLIWVDRLAALLDDFSPLAIDHAAPDARQMLVYFSSRPDRDAALQAVIAAAAPGVSVSAVSVADDGWAERSQADLRAVRVGRVIVAPPWDLPDTTSDEEDTTVVVQIRPALGFGSGHHPTTRLALLGLQQIPLHDRTVLDLGTGSGVLAIAAVQLGAQAAIGIDRDTDALDSARESLALNNVAHRVEFYACALADTAHVADVIVANLTGATLTHQRQAIHALARAGGHLVLSGILSTEAASVAAAYDAVGPCIWRATEDEWVGMMFRNDRPRSKAEVLPH
ncbi:MAG: 50S ribosomal protein L11 methyltransferase [Acidobacteria bacterium]|nr:50S ribosomal protein L11 methyltransferase [Acidobacteriota bacterium]